MVIINILTYFALVLSTLICALPLPYGKEQEECTRFNSEWIKLVTVSQRLATLVK